MGIFCSCFKSSRDPSPEVNQLEERSSPEENQLEERRSSLSAKRLCISLPSSPSTLSGRSSTSGSLERSNSQRYPQRLREKFNIANDGTTPRLECIIIPSFGSSPPPTVVVKKATGDFLQGVGGDMEIIQRLIREDSRKDLLEVRLMCHFQHVRRATFMKNIKDQMSKLKFDQESGIQKGRK